MAYTLGDNPEASRRLRLLAELSEQETREEARFNHPDLEFVRHSVVEIPFPVAIRTFYFCRFLLTRLSSPHSVLQAWARAAARGGLLAIHETEELQAEHPALVRYDEMVELMQPHHGQELYTGAVEKAEIEWLSGSLRPSPLARNMRVWSAIPRNA